MDNGCAPIARINYVHGTIARAYVFVGVCARVWFIRGRPHHPLLGGLVNGRDSRVQSLRYAYPIVLTFHRDLNVFQTVEHSRSNREP